MGNPPLSAKELTRWKHHLKIFENGIIELNDKIMRFNMNVPASLIQKQRIPYNVDREVKRVRERYLEFLPPEEEITKKSDTMDNYIASKQNERTAVSPVALEGSFYPTRLASKSYHGSI
jgi:hypothetical protein